MSNEVKPIAGAKDSSVENKSDNMSIGDMLHSRIAAKMPKVEEKPQATPVTIEHELIDTIEELKSAGIATDVINANIPLVRKLQRGVWNLEHTVKSLKGE